MNEHLYRSRDERVIAGVAGGLAERLDLDPSLVRILWLILVPLTGGFALLVYIVMAVVVPEEDRAWTPYTSAAPWTGTAPAVDPADTTTPSGSGQPVAPAQPIAPALPSWAASRPGSGAGFMPQGMDRHAWRAQRRAERAAWRAGHRSGGGAFIAGGFLIILGVLFLINEYVPSFDAGRIWPLFLVGIGVLFLVAAFGRRQSGPGSSAP